VSLDALDLEITVQSVQREIFSFSSPVTREVGMFARHVTVKLKPGTVAEFTTVMDSEILPWLRKQKGFLDAITLAVPSGREIVSISFWDQEENAQDYNSTGYPEVLEILKKILAGTPQVRTFDVVSSTLQKVDLPKTSFSTVRGRQHGDSTTAGNRAHRG
jgi:heme-degrading monooxygenase HmoA